MLLDSPFQSASERRLPLLQDAHAERGSGCSRAKGFGNVAVPADGPMCAQHFLQLFGWNLVRLDGLEIFVDQGGRMIVPVDFSERLVAIRAVPPLIPPIDDGPNQAGLGRFLDLCQTLLAASFLFRPTRAGTRAQLRAPHC